MSVSLHQKIIRGPPDWSARECQRVTGNPTIVWQKDLGKADQLAAALGAPAQPPRPKAVGLCDVAAPAALDDLSRQLDLVAIIDRHAGKRAQGVSGGTVLALAALNRCLAPTSQARLGEWSQGTGLRRLLPVAPGQLTSQRVWDHLSYLDAEKISAIEADLTRPLIDRFRGDLACLRYDTTNFYPFLDRFNDAPPLAQRGKSQEKRTDLRIVGRALLVTRDFHLPLFHHAYPGTAHDAPPCASLTETRVARYRRFSQSVEGIPLVYDQGHNSAANQATLEASPDHFVGARCPTQHPDLLQRPRARFQPRAGEALEGGLAWRTRKHGRGVERTVLVTYNPELCLTQRATSLREVRKRTRQLKALQRPLARPSPPGKPRPVAAVTQPVQALLTGRHMPALMRTQGADQAGAPRLSDRIDHAAGHRLQHPRLGQNRLFTDQDPWSDEASVRAYRGQPHIEEAFKRMQNPRCVSGRPRHHWTDQKIRVHAFYCVLALLLSSLLRRTLAPKGLELSILKIVETRGGIKAVALLDRGPRSPTPPVISYSRRTPLQARLVQALDLERFQSP